MPVYSKKVKALSADWVEAKVFRDDSEVMFEWWFSVFPLGIEAKFNRAHTWADKMIALLEKKESL